MFSMEAVIKKVKEMAPIKKIVRIEINEEGERLLQKYVEDGPLTVDGKLIHQKPYFYQGYPITKNPFQFIPFRIIYQNDPIEIPIAPGTNIDDAAKILSLNVFSGKVKTDLVWEIDFNGVKIRRSAQKFIENIVKEYNRKIQKM